MTLPGPTSILPALLITSAVLVGCGAQSGPTGPAGGLEVAVAPLSLPEVGDACYSLEVYNEAGELVWDRASICADDFGDGRSSVSYVGTCDATDLDADGTALATVALFIDGLEDTAGAPLDDWQNPCAPPHAAAGCRLTAPCRENADTLVTFNLTIMRDARQGFFDVAVSFEDIFCSAKVDCTYPDAGGGERPIELVFDPVTGERVPTVVWAFACTDGDPGGPLASSTHLYVDELVLVCGGASYALDPSAGPGAIYPGGVGAPPPLVQAMVFEGHEELLNGGEPADKLYWNVALGLRASFFSPTSGTAPTCTLETRATASNGPLVDGVTPADTNYPFIEVSVPINSGAAITCTQHPLNGAGAQAGVSTTYTGADGAGFTSIAFGYVAHATTGGVDTSPTLAPVASVRLALDTADGPAPTDPVTLGSAYVGGADVTRVLHLVNDGDLPLSLSAPTGLAAPFALVASTCGATLAVGASCALTLGFTPTAVGAASATLSWPLGYATATVSLAATGLDGRCALPWAGLLDNGASVTAYESATVPNGSTCNAETRTCADATLSGSFTEASCAVLPASLKLDLDAGIAASYPGTGTTWFDLSGRDHDATLSGVTYDPAGGGSLYFDGANDYATIPSSADFALDTNDFTISGWVYYDASTSGDDTYRNVFLLGSGTNYVGLIKWRSGIGNGFNLDYSYQGQRNLITTVSTQGDPRVAGTVGAPYSAVGRWTHFTITMTGNVMRLYLNGALNGSVTLASSKWTGAKPIYLGSLADQSYKLKGHLATFRVHNGLALSGAEVAADYDATRARFGL